MGIEATGHTRWFERLLTELGQELWVGDAARIRAADMRKQKTDARDAAIRGTAPLSLASVDAESCSSAGCTFQADSWLLRVVSRHALHRTGEFSPILFSATGYNRVRR